MKHLTAAADLRGLVRSFRQAGERVGLVPTMGFFHEGHLQLMRYAREHCDRVVVTLFVNPKQFGPNEDLASYPRDLERDARLAADTGIDVLFCPSPGEMYPPGYATEVHVAGLTEGLCGANRPGHFTGVATVVAKLFNLVDPHLAVFGQKDYQQLTVIRRLVADLNFDIEIHAHPIVREEDGLAMSSRNKYLLPEDRPAARSLHQALVAAREALRAEQSGRCPASIIEAAAAAQILAHKKNVIDYLQVIDAANLNRLTEADGTAMLVMAVRIADRVRLLDNGLLGD